MDTTYTLKIKKMIIKFNHLDSKWEYVKVRLYHYSSLICTKKDFSTVIIVPRDNEICVDGKTFTYTFIDRNKDSIVLEINFLKDYLEDSRNCEISLSSLKLGNNEEEIYLNQIPACLTISYNLEQTEFENDLKDKAYISKSAQNPSISPNANSPSYKSNKLKKISEFHILVNNLELNKDGSKLESASSTNFNTTSFTILEENDSESNIIVNETFCNAFFISGLPFKNAKLIPDSDIFPAPCDHKICSNLPSYKAELLTKFPLHDKNSKIFEMTNATASLCFPFGIKLCFTQNENEIQPMKNFMTVTTSESGNRNFIYVYHYYQKVDFFEFKQLYDFDPVKDQFLQNKIITLINQSVDQNKLNSSIEKKIQENLKICSELISSDYIYLPTAACLVSSLPLTNQMERSLEAIIKTAIDEKRTSNDLARLVHHLIYEVPIPPVNKSLSFYLPYMSNPIHLQGKFLNDLPLIPMDSPSLFNYFTVDMILNIHLLMLFEMKILFVCNDFSKLIGIMEAFITLLYPMTWTGTYIPVLSENLIKYIQSFMPFIMGINENMLKKAMEYFEEDSTIYLIHIKEKAGSTMEMSSVSHNRVKKSTSRKSLTGVLPELPNECKEIMTKDLKYIKKLYENEKANFNNSFTSVDSLSCDTFNYKLDKSFRMIFIKTMIRLFGDYSQFTTYINDQACFNTEAFLAEKPSRHKEFYNEFILSTMFGLFTHDSQQSENFAKLCKKYSKIILKNNNRRKSSYFIKEEMTYVSKDFETTLKTKNILKSANALLDLKLNTQRVRSNKDLPDMKRLCLSNTKRQSDKDLLKINNETLCNNLNDSINSFNSDYPENYLISPYFILLMCKDPTKIEEMVLENLKKENMSLLTQMFSKKIFTFRNSIRELPQERFKRYIIPSLFALDSTKENIMNTLGEDLTEKKTRGELLDHLKNILNSRNNHPIDRKDLIRIFTNKGNRMYFSSILFQKKFLEHNCHSLNPNGFDNLVRMVSTTLLLSQNDVGEFDHIRILTKSCFCYYKNLKTGERVYVYEEITRTKPFDIWLNRDFWENWFLIDLKEKREDSSTMKLTIEDIYFMILIDLGTIMINLNVEVNIVVYVIVEKVGVKYLNNKMSLLKNLELTLFKHLDNKLKEKDI